MPQAIFVALGAEDRSSDWSLVTLTDFLVGKRLMLVIDNCEHHLDACAILASTLVKACPELHLLATSRQALGVVGEVRMPVPPMSLPRDGEEASAEGLANSEAVRFPKSPTTPSGDRVVPRRPTPRHLVADRIA